MPPVSPQGSRNGLITAVVVFVVLFITSTIFAIYYAANANKAETQWAEAKKRSQEVYQDISSPEFTELQTYAKGNPNLREKTVLAAALDQIHGLSRKMTGTVSTTQPADAAAAAADQALAAAAAKVKEAQVRVETDSLTSALTKLADYAAATRDQLGRRTKDAEAAAQDAANKIAAAQKLLDDRTKDVEKAQADVKAAQDAAASYQTDELGKVADATKGFETERQSFNDALKKAQDANTDLQNQLAQAKKQISALTTKLGNTRVPVEDPIVRQQDGQIIQVAGSDVVYINLGQGDHVSPGLTFEVYDKNAGIPKLGDSLTNDNLPIGVASIEVDQVGPTSSRCRVTKTELGQQIQIGDPIVNLVYDRNAKYNFFVYGNFDLDQNGVATPQDADKIKQIITQWGGKIEPQIDVKTDFVVVGTPPTVPSYTAEELNDPFNKANYEAAVAAQKQYDSVIDQAKDLHIPIMNQNRFLYFCGYYDVAKR